MLGITGNNVIVKLIFVIAEMLFVALFAFQYIA